MYNVSISSVNITGEGGKKSGGEKKKEKRKKSPNKSYYILAFRTLNIFPSVYLARKKKRKKERNRIVIKKEKKTIEKLREGESYPHLLKITS